MTNNTHGASSARSTTSTQSAYQLVVIHCFVAPLQRSRTALGLVADLAQPEQGNFPAAPTKFPAKHLQNLVLVAGHAVYTGEYLASQPLCLSAVLMDGHAAGATLELPFYIKWDVKTDEPLLYLHCSRCQKI